MLDSIQQEIDSFYAKYAEKEGITLAQAKQRVSRLDIEEYQRKAAKYVKDRDFSDQANAEMRLYNLTMKINRLEMLKANIGMELVESFDELQKFFGEKLTNRALDEFERLAGIFGDTVQNNAKRAATIVNASFHHATFSDRIWMYQDVLKSELSKLLEQGMIQGKGSRELARSLRKVFDTSRSDAERLMSTELRRVQTEAAKQSYEANENDEYEFMTANAQGPCDVCKKLNGKIFKVKDMMPGKNAPPMHPRCHCCTAPHWDEAKFQAYLREENRKMHQRDGMKRSFERGDLNFDIKRIGTNEVDLDYLKSEKFRSKFNQITENSAVNDALRQYATAMLTHRRNTDGEDAYIIDSETGKLLVRRISGKNDLGVALTQEEAERLRRDYPNKAIGIHNHPTNILPTGSDFAVAGYRKYKFGIVVTHDGRVFQYSAGTRPFLPDLLDGRVDKYIDRPYNMSIEEAHKKTLEKMKEEYGIQWREIK